MKNKKQFLDLFAGFLIAMSLAIGFTLVFQGAPFAFAQVEDLCEDTLACNYGEAAVCDYSCICNDAGACNYGATDTCEYTSCRCQDTASCNYGEYGSCDYTSCLVDVCSDPAADNFSPGPYIFPFVGSAGSPPCVYYDRGCAIPQCANFDPLTQQPVGSGGHAPDNNLCQYDPVCTTEKDGNGVPYQNYVAPPVGPCEVERQSVCIAGIPGCTDSEAVNYEPDATFDDGSCTYDPPKCDVYVNACCSARTGGLPNTNYKNPLGPCDVCDNASCIPAAAIPGCMNSTASNYNPLANVDDASCYYPYCEFSVAYSFSSIVASTTYSGTMAIKTYLSVYGVPPGPTACDSLATNENFESDVVSIVEIIQLTLPIYPPIVCDDCINIDLTTRDLCPNIEGQQPIMPYGYTKNGDGDCVTDEVPSDTSLCGTATLGDPEYGGAYMNSSDIIVTTLCAGTSSPSAITRNGSNYNWTCTNFSTGSSTACHASARCGSDGMYLCASGVCAANQSGCNITGGGGNGILKTVTVRPKIVRSEDKLCGLFFTTDTTDPEANITCTVDGTAVTESATPGTWNTTITVGEHPLRCVMNNDITDATTTRCVLNPKYNEF